MSKNSSLEADNQVRLIFATGIIASYLGFTQVSSNLMSLIPARIIEGVSVILLVAAVFSFAYLITTAASLKYDEVSQTRFFKSSSSQRKILYNLSVDTFMYVPWFFIVAEAIRHYSSIVSSAEEFALLVTISLALSLLAVWLVWRLFFGLLNYMFERKETNLHRIHGLIAYSSALLTTFFLWDGSSPSQLAIKTVLILILLRGFYSHIKAIRRITALLPRANKRNQSH